MLLLNLFNDSGKLFRIKKIGLVLGLAGFAWLTGCNNNILPVPEFTENVNSSSNKSIAAPAGFTASHGEKGQITLSWTSVQNAKLYYIYKADSPHAKYEQIDEANGEESSKVISVPTGYSAYFKIAAVDPIGTTSDLSLAAFGTSLAVPLITSIEPDKNESTVYWYMENVSKNSYLKKIQYSVSCYNKDGSLRETKIIQGCDTSGNAVPTYTTFTNLDASTKYLFEVEAYLIDSQTASEKSARVDADTVVSLIPKAPEFTVSEGTHEKTITLTITLPQMCKVQSEAVAGTGGISYEEKPLYFKIYRREYIAGSNAAWDFSTPHVVYLAFNGTTTEIPKDDNAFDGYKQGDVISWSEPLDAESNPTIKRGAKYEYRVVPYIDNYFTSASTPVRKGVNLPPEKSNLGTGWACAIPSFATKNFDYNLQPKDAEDVTKGYYKAGASIEFTAKWNSFGKDADYVYLLNEHRALVKDDNGGNEDTVGTDSFAANQFFANLDDVLSYVRSFTLINKDTEGADEENKKVRGYYDYTLYIVKANAKSDYETPNADGARDELLKSVEDGGYMLTSVKDVSTTLVTDKDVPVPELEAADGYKDKALLTVTKCSTETNATYVLRKQVIDLMTGEIDSSVDAEIIKLVTEGNAENEVTKSTYLDPADNVEKVKLEYTLEKLDSGKAYALTVIGSVGSYSNITGPVSTKKIYTLGTPAPVFNYSDCDYKTVIIRWNKVQKAGSYEVSHNGKSWIFNQADFEDSENDIVKKDDEDGLYSLECIKGTDYTMTIRSIEGFNYEGETPVIEAKNAGKELTVAVKAINSLDTTQADAKVRTLGPAELGLTASQAVIENGADGKTQIATTWNMVCDAPYYAVQRVCPNITDPAHPIKDIYYVSKDAKVYIGGEEMSSSRVTASVNGSKIYLLEKQCNNVDDQTVNYQVNQTKIIWGLRYKYTVIPVKSMDDNPFDSSLGFTYTNLDDSTITKEGYTSGYGLNITASKATSVDSIHVTWEKASGINAIPKLWYRCVGESGWYQVQNIKTDGDKSNAFLKAGLTTSSQEADVVLQDNRTDCVEFAVRYDAGTVANWPDSYLEYLGDRKESDGVEQKNWGYEFSLPALTASHPDASNESFTEIIEWDIWDYTKRKYGAGDGITGDCYEIQVKNQNCSSKWFTIATVSKEGKLSLANDPGWYNVAIVPGSNTMSITANGVTDKEGAHDGLLKVQRDYKHYYRIKGTRKNGDEILTAYLGNTNNTSQDSKAGEAVYSYRKISAEEFAKCASLNVAEAIFRTGVYEGANGEDSIPDKAYDNGASGHFGVYHQSGTKTFLWGTGNTAYRHIYACTPADTSKSFTSNWTISCGNSKSYAAADGKKIHYLPEATFTVKHDLDLPSYNGTLKLSAGIMGSHSFLCITDSVKSQWKLSLDATSQTGKSSCSVDNDAANFKSWFPYSLFSNNTGYSSYSEGLPIYQNYWFTVRTGGED